MNDLAERKIFRGGGLFRSLFFLGAGVFFIVSNAHMYRLFGVFVGIAFCMCAPGLYVAPLKAHLAATGKIWVYRAVAVTAWCALTLLLVVGAALWLGVGSTVAATQMVHHPLLYNNRLVHTSGYVLAGDGYCTLEIPSGANQAHDGGRGSMTMVWLSSSSKLCAAPTASHFRANISGRLTVLRSGKLTVLRPSKDAVSRYALAGATITRVGGVATGPST